MAATTVAEATLTPQPLEPIAEGMEKPTSTGTDVAAVNEDVSKPYTPADWTIDEIRRVIPPELFERSAFRSMLYLVRDLTMAVGMVYAASKIDNIVAFVASKVDVPSYGLFALKWSLWATYWWFQSLIMCGLWVIGHEAGHRGISSNGLFCDILGYVLHSALLTPYWSWKISHHRHHMTHGCMERDELWMPDTRSYYGLPPEEEAEESDYEEIFGDAPLYTFIKLLAFHFFLFQAYLIFNLSGQKSYPSGTSHYNPKSVLYRPSQRWAIVLSDIGVAATIYAVYQLPTRTAWLYYWVPWFGLSHWIILMTFLHHTDPKAPHYREKAWTFTRGASATIDRDFLGWQGRFFMHGISHWHVVHHYFPKMPFYNGEEATQYLKKFMGEHYISSDVPVFKAFWHNWNECRFVEDKGSVLFYRNKKGKSVRVAAEELEIKAKAKAKSS